MDSLRSVILLLLSVAISSGREDGVYEYAADSGTSELGQDPGNTYEQFPSTYAIWFEHDGQLLYYNLYRDDVKTKTLSPSIFKLTNYLPDDLMTDDNEDEFAFYHNGEQSHSDSRAGFVLHRTSAATEAKVFGFFRLDGQQFFLEHDGANQHKTRRDISKEAKRTKRNAPLKVIEIFVVTAPDVFRFHKTRLASNVRQTEEFLRIWERAIIRDANVIFEGLNTTQLGIYYVGGYNDRSLSVDWYANNVDGKLILRTAVDDLAVDLVDLVADNLIPAADHYLVLTRQNIVDTFAGQGVDKIAYGIPDTICQSPVGSSVSMAEVSSPFFIKAVAQSIVFSFGIPYYFLGAEYTVMSRSVNTNIPFSERSSRWRVDQVSSDRIKTKVDELDGQCLDTHGDDFDYFAFLATPAYGELYPTLQEQCKMFAGDDSNVCEGDTTTSEVCYNGVKCTNLRGLCRLDYFTGSLTTCNGDSGGLVSEMNKYLETYSGMNTYEPCHDKTWLYSIPNSVELYIKVCLYGNCLEPVGTTDVNMASTTSICKCEQLPLGEVQLSSTYTPCP